MRRARKLYHPLFFVALLLGLATPAYAAVSLDVPKHVPAKETITVNLRSSDLSFDSGKLRVVYRPGSMVEITEEFPVPMLAVNEPLSLEWTPKEPGIVRLEYHARAQSPDAEAARLHASALVGVTFASVPLSGLAVMLLAGFFLFGGCGAACWLLRRQPEADSPPPSS